MIRSDGQKEKYTDDKRYWDKDYPVCFDWTKYKIMAKAPWWITWLMIMADIVTMTDITAPGAG